MKQEEKVWKKKTVIMRMTAIRRYSVSEVKIDYKISGIERKKQLANGILFDMEDNKVVKPYTEEYTSPHHLFPTIYHRFCHAMPAFL